MHHDGGNVKVDNSEVAAAGEITAPKLIKPYLSETVLKGEDTALHIQLQAVAAGIEQLLQATGISTRKTQNTTNETPITPINHTTHENNTTPKALNRTAAIAELASQGKPDEVGLATAAEKLGATMGGGTRIKPMTPMTPITATHNINKLEADLQKQKQNLHMTNQLNAEETQHTYHTMDKHQEAIKTLQQAVANIQTQTCIHACMHTYIHTHVHTYIHGCIDE